MKIERIGMIGAKAVRMGDEFSFSGMDAVINLVADHRSF